MYCRNCGKELSDQAVACTQCGMNPRHASKFCHSCGAETKPDQVVCVKCGVSLTSGAAGTGEKSKIAAGLLGIFLGALGIHKFYLGYNVPGIIMLVVTLVGSWFTFGIAAMVMGIIGLIEGIIYLTKSDPDFHATYVAGKKGWF
jgi:TM2 domain-containing membrane protein YozV